MKGPIALATLRTTAVLGLRLLVQAGTLLLVARMLGPRAFGAFSGVAALAVVLGTLSTFGTHLVLLGEVAKDASRRHAVLRYALPTTLVCGSLLLAIHLAICLLALREAGIAPHVLLLLGLAEILVQPLVVLCASEHHGLGRIAQSQALIMLPMLLRLVAAATVFVLQPADVLGAYAWGYALASIVALLCVLGTLPAAWPSIRQWRLPRRTDLLNTAGFAALNITAAGPTEIDKTLATRLLPLGGAGLYAAAARIIGAATLPISAMTASALPRLFREGQDRSGRPSHLLRWMFGAACGYSASLAALLWIAAPVFDWIFGSRYHGIAQVIRWLCIAVPGMALRRVAGNILMAFHRPWARFGFELSGLASLVVASILATRHFGAIGMSVALCISEWVMALFGISLVIAALSRQSGIRKMSASTQATTPPESGE